MIGVVQHETGMWIIALNPYWERKDLLTFEYAWAWTAWTKGESPMVFFPTEWKAREYLKANRAQLDAAYAGL